jgi:predicted nuclease of predicted toxin-antitoxin system
VRLLADMGISMATVRALREAGEEVVHLREQGLHTMPDDQIMAKGVREQRAILTCDLDFGDLLAASGGSVPSVILIRTRNQTPKAVTPRLFQVMQNVPHRARGGGDHYRRGRRLPPPPPAD